MNGVMTDGVSAGSNQVGASETCTAQVISPAGAAASGPRSIRTSASVTTATARLRQRVDIAGLPRELWPRARSRQERGPAAAPSRKDTAMRLSRRRSSLVVLGLVLSALTASRAASQTAPRGHGAEAHDMELVGHDDLQGRAAYQPTIHVQRGRVIAYVGHHGGRARNPLTGVEEDNGTSIVDVTDAARPRYLFHIPGQAGGPEQGGAQMARVCDRGGKTWLLRTSGNSVPNSGHEVWDV